MNAGPPPPRPDDEASDPLLAALRQRLGDYGQAPPPGAWAAIRTQLPPLPAPRPWWHRSRRLLPLLLLLLGIIGAGTVVVWRGQLARRSQLAKAGKTTIAHVPRSIKSNGDGLKKPSKPKANPGASAVSAINDAAAPAGSPSSLSASGEAAAEGTAHNRLAKLPASATAAAAASASLPAPRPEAPGKGATRATAQPLVAQRTARGAPTPKNSALTPADREQPQALSLLARPPASRPLAGKHAPPALAAVAGASTATTTHLGPAGAPPARPSLTARRNSKQHRAAFPEVALGPATSRRAKPATTQPGGATSRPSASGPARAAGEQAPVIIPVQVDSLGLRMAALGLPVALPRPALIARPDSVWPPLPRARRWSVLVLAGPTLSYRTLGAAPTLAARHPDFARLERPALGLGAQVQVRRVLSGRWALAAGLGYHEYATRLALSIVDTIGHNPRSVHQRDVYRVLTLPVQLSYALGAPRGRLAWALLVGAEPSWYLGGRSTEGSGCGCQQQSYPLDSARTGPYRPLTLAISLGLDLRYRLGGPASRWQWVVQPTARYIITPFVRREAVGFTRRQPWSLGLLTGISWDLH